MFSNSYIFLWRFISSPLSRHESERKAARLVARASRDKLPDCTIGRHGIIDF